MTTKIFSYKSTGIQHSEENQFFHFLVKNIFAENRNRSVQWCKFEGLNIIVETLEPSIIDFVKLSIPEIIETSSGYKYELINH